MSWKLGRSKKSSVSNLLAEDVVNSRSVTPTPGNPDGKPSSRSGLLAIRVLWAEGLALPAGFATPAAVQQALSSQQAKVASSVSPSSVQQSRLAKTRGNRYVPRLGCLTCFNTINRDSIQRTQCWWLPYLVMEYEVNQVLITPPRWRPRETSVHVSSSFVRPDSSSSWRFF